MGRCQELWAFRQLDEEAMSHPAKARHLRAAKAKSPYLLIAVESSISSASPTVKVTPKKKKDPATPVKKGAAKKG